SARAPLSRAWGSSLGTRACGRERRPRRTPVSSWVERLAGLLSAPGSSSPSRLSPTASVAAALTVAPVLYATRPVQAEELLRRTCADCAPGSRCCGGYTAFCCTLPNGNNYGCPNGTFVGGWWQCNYGGGDLCGTTNRRYYMD